MRFFPIVLVACATAPATTPTTAQPTPELEAAYAEACAMREHEQIAVSPLARHGLRSENTSTGAIVYVGPDAGAPAILLADLRCHRVWMMLPRSNARVDCALGMPGLRVDVNGDAWTSQVTLSVSDPLLVPELQRRVAKELEHRR